MIRILLIENDIDNIKLIKNQIIKSFNFELRHVDNENDFNNNLETFKPDIILSNYFTKNFTTKQALNIRNQKSSIVPFIIITAIINEKLAINLIKQDATDYVTKEHLQRLPQTIKQALKEKILTEEKNKAEKDLQERERLFRRFVENDISGDYMETENEVVFCNKKVLDMFGFKTLEELNNYGTKNLYFENEKRKYFYEKLKKYGKVENFKMKMHDKEGNIIHIIENAFAEFDENGKILYIFGYIFDITQQINYELKLKKSEELFRSLADNSATGIVIYDKYKFYYVNNAIASITGYSKKELLSLGILDLVHPNYKKIVKQNALQRIKGKEIPSNYDFQIITKNGYIRWLNVSGASFKNKEMPAAIATLTDITERKIAEKRISNNSKRLEILVNLVETDINNVSDILDYGLEKLLSFIKSKIGYIYFYNEQTQLFTFGSWSKSVMKECEITQEGSTYPLEQTGIWGEVVRQRKPIVINNFQQANSLKKGYPENHVRLKNFMSIPIFENKKIVAVVGIGNKESDFTEEDIYQTRLLVDAIWKEAQRKIAVEALTEREENFSNMVENSPNGIIIVQPDGKIVYANSAVSKITGYTNNELLTLNSYENLIISEEITAQRNKQKKHPPVYEQKLITKNRETVITEFHTTTTTWQGKHLQMIEIRDLTMQRKAEEEIKMLYLAIEQSSVSVVITNYEGDIEYVNKYFTKLTGYTSEEVLGQNPRILQSGETPKEIYPDLWDTIKSGNTWQGEFINRKKNGDEYIEQARIAPVFNTTGNIVRFIAIKEDITLKKDYERKLIDAKEKAEEADKLKTNFLANVSHELRTPLNGILGFAELLETEDEVETMRNMAGYIKISSLRLMNTLNLIIDYSILGAEKIKISISSVDLPKLIRQIVNSYNFFAEAKGIFLNFEPEEEKCNIISDKSMIEKALTNIIDNAIKFTQKGGVSVELETYDAKKTGSIKINIRDTGIGIASKHRKIIFEPFRQASEGYGRSFEGIGLGLPISLRLIKTLGGNISFTSQLGKGSNFIISIPTNANKTQLKFQPKKSKSTKIYKTPNRKKPSILYIDDDIYSLELMATIFKNKYNIDTGNTYDTGLELIKKNTYDLLIFDINLGKGKDGLMLLESINKLPQYKKVPKLALTAYASTNDKNEFLSKGFSAYLSKPVRQNDLLKTVENLLHNNE